MSKIPLHSYLRIVEAGSSFHLRPINMRITDPIGGNIYPSTPRWDGSLEPGGFGGAIENWLRYTGPQGEFTFTSGQAWAA